jgi:hypothetical protein
VIHPHVVRAENGHCISVCHASVPDMGRCAYHLQKGKKKELVLLNSNDQSTWV